MGRWNVYVGVICILLAGNGLAQAVDLDGDGFSVEQWDCNDSNPAIHPQAIEICRDGIDQNCDGNDLLICLEDALRLQQVLTGSQQEELEVVRAGLMEAGADGQFGMAEVLDAFQLVSGLGGGAGKDFDGDGFTAAMGDRNDNDLMVFPGAPEICGDYIDQDCDGADLLCAVDQDQDQDGYTPAEGDCNDQHAGVYPGAVDTPQDSMDQDCDGCDALSPPYRLYANELFISNSGGFIAMSPFRVSGGRFLFDGAGGTSIYRNLWNGGSNPSNSWVPSTSHTNYFNKYRLSVDTYWRGGSDEGVYGVFLSSSGNSSDFDHLLYLIDKTGYFQIYEYRSATGYDWLDGGYSFLLNRNMVTNTIEVEKEGNRFRFFINGLEVKRLKIDGFDGGGVGLLVEDSVDVAFDNFKVRTPEQPSCVADDFVHFGVSEQNEFVYTLMKSLYLWYDQVPVVDHGGYSSPEALLDDLIYEERDKWSYITTTEEYQSHFEDGRYVGTGFGTRYDGESMRISFVYPGSPADLAGMRRGDKILEVNGRPASVIEDEDMWDRIFGEREHGVIVKMLLLSPTGELKNLTMEKAWVEERTVLHHEIIDLDGIKVGYLVFKGFIDVSRDELQVVFSEFKAAGIDELILDLRYNGGGRLSVAEYLASLIGGTRLNGKLFEELVYNSNNQHRNYSYLFSSEDLALLLDRVFFITSDGTASASESVIMGLRPFMETVLIGKTTSGKPVGSSGFEIGDKYVNAIQFKGLNADGEGEFFEGIAVDCEAADGMTFMFGDRSEPSLHEALEFIRTGSCLPEPVQPSPKRVVRDKRMRMTGFQAEIGAY